MISFVWTTSKQKSEERKVLDIKSVSIVLSCKCRQQGANRQRTTTTVSYTPRLDSGKDLYWRLEERGTISQSTHLFSSLRSTPHPSHSLFLRTIWRWKLRNIFQKLFQQMHILREQEWDMCPPYDCEIQTAISDTKCISSEWSPKKYRRLFLKTKLKSTWHRCAIPFVSSDNSVDTIRWK
jgi:hypothetical protein